MTRDVQTTQGLTVSVGWLPPPPVLGLVTLPTFATSVPTSIETIVCSTPRTGTWPGSYIRWTPTLLELALLAPAAQWFNGSSTTLATTAVFSMATTQSDFLPLDGVQLVKSRLVRPFALTGSVLLTLGWFAEDMTDSTTQLARVLGFGSVRSKRVPLEEMTVCSSPDSYLLDLGPVRSVPFFGASGTFSFTTLTRFTSVF